MWDHAGAASPLLLRFAREELGVVAARQCEVQAVEYGPCLLGAWEVVGAGAALQETPQRSAALAAVPAVHLPATAYCSQYIPEGALLCLEHLWGGTRRMSENLRKTIFE